MEQVGVRELKGQATQILRRVRHGEPFEITYRGRVIARLVPTEETGPKRDADQWMREWKQLAAEIGKHSPKHVDAVELIREGRRY